MEFICRFKDGQAGCDDLAIPQRSSRAVWIERWTGQPTARKMCIYLLCISTDDECKFRNSCHDRHGTTLGISNGESRRSRNGEVSQLVRTFLINNNDDLALDRLGPKACTDISLPLLQYGVLYCFPIQGVASAHSAQPLNKASYRSWLRARSV